METDHVQKSTISKVKIIAWILIAVNALTVYNSLGG